MTRTCDWCRNSFQARRDAKTCSKKCRQARHRFRVGVAPAAETDVAPREATSVAGDSSQPRHLKLAYADPPYPGLAKRYYGEEAQEVNHSILIGTLMRDYDAWALSTSAAALSQVLALCPPEARVCAWIKGPQSSVAMRPHSAWEPLIVYGGRMRRIPASERLTDTLLWGGRQHSHPGALVGMKPAAFCEWMFRQLGAARQDTMADIFPGSGAVARAWRLYTSGSTPATASRRSEAAHRLAEQLGAGSRR